MGDSKRNFSGRLVNLREIDIEQDAPEWFEAMQEPDMHVWTDNKIPNDIDEVRNVVLTTYATHPEIIAWCIRDCETDEMVGIYWIGVPCMSDDGKRITFDAQRIAKPYWRQGYTKEAKSLVFSTHSWSLAWKKFMPRRGNPISTFVCTWKTQALKFFKSDLTLTRNITRKSCKGIMC